MKTALAALALLSAAAISPLVGQGDEEYARKTLVGVKGVCVLVEPIIEDVQRRGLDTLQIRTDVELKLRQAGITVLTREQVISSAGVAYLDVNVQAFKTPLDQIPLYAYHVHLALHQRVMLIRDPAVTVLAATWSVNSLGVAGAERLGSVRDIVRDQTDQFSNAYLAANPKR